MPGKLLEECMQAVQESGLQEGSGGGGMTGRKLVVKYKEGGRLLRISSEDTDNTAGFYSVRFVLQKAWSDYYIPEENQDVTEDISENNESESIPPQEAGDPWFCPECGRRNTGSVCLDCGLEKPEE